MRKDRVYGGNTLSTRENRSGCLTVVVMKHPANIRHLRGVWLKNPIQARKLVRQLDDSNHAVCRPAQLDAE
jgi:hypothetical protein